jgi:hypothetical protein
MLRCPDPSCNAAVGQDMINVLTSNEDSDKYSRYFIRSYIEDNRKVILHSEIWILILYLLFFNCLSLSLVLTESFPQ